MLAPSGNDVRHERRLVHRRAEVALVVVAGRCTDAFELGMGGSDPRPLVAIERELGSVSDMFCTPCLRSMVTTAYRPASVAKPLGKSLKRATRALAAKDNTLAGVPRGFPPRAGKCSGYPAASTETMRIPVHPGTRSKSGSLAKFTAIHRASL